MMAFLQKNVVCDSQFLSTTFHVYYTDIKNIRLVSLGFKQSELGDTDKKLTGVDYKFTERSISIYIQIYDIQIDITT